MKIELSSVAVGQRDSKFWHLHARFDWKGTRHVVTSSLFHDRQTPPEVAQILREFSFKVDAIPQGVHPETAPASWDEFVATVKRADECIKSGSLPLRRDDSILGPDFGAPLFEVGGYKVFRR